MVLGDFLSRQNNDDSNPHEIIPISFICTKCYIRNIIIQKLFSTNMIPNKIQWNQTPRSSWHGK